MEERATLDLPGRLKQKEQRDELETIRKNVSIQGRKSGWPSRLPGLAITNPGPSLFLFAQVPSELTHLP